MDDISYRLDVERTLLHAAINNNKDLDSDYILELSQKLDKIIVEAYKKELNINKE